MNILYLVPHVPNPTKVRSFFQIRGLLKTGHRVTVVTLVRSVEDKKHISRLEQMGCGVIWEPLEKPLMLINTASAFITGLPMQAKLMWSETLMRRIEAFLESNPPDVIHVEHLRMAVYGLRLVSKWNVVWDAVDHLTTLYEQAASTSVSRLWQLAARLEAPRLKKHEIALTGQFPATLVISQQDLELFQRNNLFSERVHLAPLGLELAPQTASVQRAENVLMITGTLNYHPNIAAVQNFVQKIFPLVLQKRPDTKLRLVGANPVSTIMAVHSEQITVTGYVPSISEVLRTATIALAPITYGSGVQVKVLEAFSTSTPLVATAIALRGLDAQNKEHVLVADTPADFADAIIHLLSDPILRQELGEAGRHYVEQHHNLEVTTNNLIEIYQCIFS